MTLPRFTTRDVGIAACLAHERTSSWFRVLLGSVVFLQLFTRSAQLSTQRAQRSTARRAAAVARKQARRRIMRTPAAAGAIKAKVARSPTVCAYCENDFMTRSSLHRHLRQPVTTCPAPRDDPGEKIMLLFGYNCLKEGSVAGGDRAGELIRKAIGGTHLKSVGFSQASSITARRCPILAQEQGISAT